MNANEGISLAKMAIGVLLMCLVLSGVLLLWYMLYGAENKQIEEWNKAADSAAAERLYELAMQTEDATNNSQPDKLPLVTNVCNALAEFTEEGVVFISVYDTATSVTHVFTYESLNLDVSSFSGTVELHESTVPLTHAASYLLKTYNKNRCLLKKIDVGVDGSGKYTPSSGNMFLAYDIQIVN